MKFAPVFMIFNAFWMLDNQQIFKNKWAYKERIDDSMISQHYISEINLCQSSPLAYLILFILFSYLIKLLLSERTLALYGFYLQKQQFQVWENLPPFNEALTADQVSSLDFERSQLSKKYKFETLNQEEIQVFKKCNHNNRKFDNLPWYVQSQILNYQLQFAYTPPHYHHRFFEIGIHQDMGHTKYLNHMESYLYKRRYTFCDHCMFKYNPHIVPVFLHLSALPVYVLRKMDITGKE